MAFLPFSLLTPWNLDALFITSGRSAAACSRIKAVAPSAPSAFSVRRPSFSVRRPSCLSVQAQLATLLAAPGLAAASRAGDRKCGLWREQILEALDSSLARLQTDYVDLFQLHWPARYTPIFSAKRYQRRHERRPEDIPAVDEQVLAIKECLDSGKVKAWGLSNENAVGVSLFLESCRRLGVPPPATIQNDFSAAHRRFEEDGTAEACAPLQPGKMSA